MPLYHRLSLILLGCVLVGSVKAQTIHVAVAANFSAPMKAIASRFEQQSAFDVALSFGSSGKFVAQIQHGAPFQVFLSADQAKPMALEAAGLSVPGTRTTYAVGGLVLWSAQADSTQMIADRLTTGNFRKLALANPALAPYGTAAVQVLKALDLEAATRPAWVMGENIAQTFQFVASGNADLGFVALSQVSANGQITSGAGWIIPTDLYQPIRQDAVLLAKALEDERSKAGALALLDYLRSAEARAIIHSYGYTTE